MELLLLVAGLVCLFAPDWMLAAFGMGSLEDEGCFVWGVRLFGGVLIGIFLWTAA